jgi:glycosyltransferase involved in cell wall biosynthesis
MCNNANSNENEVVLGETITLHVGFLTSEYVIPPSRLDGGLATYIQKVGRALVKRGQRVSVFCLSDRNFDWIDEGVHVYEVLAGSSKLSQVLNSSSLPTTEIEEIFLNSSRLAKRLWEVNEKDPIDIIQAASYQAVGIALCNNQRIPLITRVSSFAALYRNAGAVGDKPNTISTALTDWGEIYQVDNSDRTFAPSALMAKYYSLFSKATPLTIKSPIGAYCQDQDESFYEQNLKGMKYLLFFGTLNRMKGVEIISKSVGGLLEKFPDLHFVFIGRTHIAENNQSYAVKILRDNEKWSKNLHYFPSLPKQKLYPAIRHSYGILIPSIIDNYPNACLEAMQCGKIVIGTVGSSLDEMIVDGETGILVQNNDVESLQAGIRKLLFLSHDRKSAMEEKILKTFNDILSEDRIGQLIDLYTDTILTYQPGANKDQFTWDGILLRDKFRKNLSIGFLRGIILKVHQKLNHYRKSPIRKSS